MHDKTFQSIKVFMTGCFILLSQSVLLGQSKVGTTSVPFLGISVGPRATAMGGAFVGMSDDATALYYNPGGFVANKQSQFMVSHTNWLVGSSFNWVGFVLKLNSANALGFSVTQLDYGEDEVTTVYEPEGTGEKWSAMDLAAAVSYSRYLTDRFSIGGSVKYIQQRIWNESASTFAFDVGLLFVTQFNDMRLGMSISNFGAEMKMDGRDLLQQVDVDPAAAGNNEDIVSILKTESWPLPLFFRVGVAMDVLRLGNHRLTIAVDALRPTDNTEIVNAGAELGIGDFFFLRAGYKSLFRDESEEGLTMGFGLNLPLINSLACNLDYTFADFGLFEEIHMVALAFEF